MKSGECDVLEALQCGYENTHYWGTAAHLGSAAESMVI